MYTWVFLPSFFFHSGREPNEKWNRQRKREREVGGSITWPPSFTSKKKRKKNGKVSSFFAKQPSAFQFPSSDWNCLGWTPPLPHKHTIEYYQMQFLYSPKNQINNRNSLFLILLTKKFSRETSDGSSRGCIGAHRDEFTKKKKQFEMIPWPTVSFIVNECYLLETRDGKKKLKREENDLFISRWMTWPITTKWQVTSRLSPQQKKRKEKTCRGPRACRCIGS